MCDYCTKQKPYITPHQASDNDKSETIIIGDSLIARSWKNDIATAEINVDILYCPFCGSPITN